MNVFDLRARIISDYSTYIRSFIQIADDRLRRKSARAWMPAFSGRSPSSS